MALAVISLVASFGFASADPMEAGAVIGDGTSEVHVYVRTLDGFYTGVNVFPFDVTVIEGGSVTIHNESQRVIDIQHTGTVGTENGGTFGSVISIDSAHSFNFPISNCSVCFPAGIYYYKYSVSGVTGSIAIIHPDGYTVQEEVGITENVVVVLGNNSTKTTPEPTPIEPTGKYNVATWTGTYDMVLLQEQLAEVSANFNQAVENLGHEKNKVKQLQSQINDINVGYIKTLADKKDLEDELTTILMVKNEVISDLQNKINNTPDYTEQIAYMTSSVDTLENKVIKLEQEKAEITIEKEKWKTLSDNWYAVAVEQLRVMVNVLGL